jgi:lipoprotein-releasing system permease protein
MRLLHSSPHSMNRLLVSQFAIRYLRGKKSANAVPILSRISMVAIAVASCAMIILFSVFNGFEHIVKDLYKAFYPELKITAKQGKFFAVTPAQVAAIQQVKGVQQLAYVIEDQVLVNSRSNQMIATVKGIDRHYLQVNPIQQYIAEGRDTVGTQPEPTAIIGSQVQAHLEVDVNNAFERISLTYPNANAGNITLHPESAFQSVDVKPDGVFHIQDDFDGKYILAPLTITQSLLQQPGKYSSIELLTEPGTDPEQVKHTLQQQLGNQYVVATRYEQNQALYLVMRTEKWAVYIILLLVLLIASFNMVGALALLVLEKQQDIAILKAMGATPTDIRNIFMSEGILWSLIGGMSGIILGTLICVGQQQFHWVKMEGAFIIDAYPVRMQIWDYVWVIVTVLLVGVLASWYPAHRATRTEAPTLKGA